MLTYQTNYPDQLDKIFSAIANSVRRAIIEQVAEKESTVNELAEPHSISRPAISQHLRVLENAGIIEQTLEGRIRICKLNVKPLSLAFSWLVRYRIFWEGLFDDIQEKVEADTNLHEDVK